MPTGFCSSLIYHSYAFNINADFLNLHASKLFYFIFYTLDQVVRNGRDADPYATITWKSMLSALSLMATLMPCVRLSLLSSLTRPSFILTAAMPTIPKHSTAVVPAYIAITSGSIWIEPILMSMRSFWLTTSVSLLCFCLIRILCHDFLQAGFAGAETAQHRRAMG